MGRREENQKQSYRRRRNAERGNKIKQHSGKKEQNERGKKRYGKKQSQHMHKFKVCQ